MNIYYPTKRWRYDADGYHRLIGSGNGAVPAVIASVTSSTMAEHKGEFWWGIDDTIRGYKPTIEEAKAEAERAATELEEKP